MSSVSAAALAMALPGCASLTQPRLERAQSKPASLAAAHCSVESLRPLVGASVAISEATTTEAGVCRVRGAVATSGEGAPPGSARFELNLPSDWNRRFIFLGGGGYDGNIPQAPDALLARGYATLGTDSGHIESPAYPPNGMDATWAINSAGDRDEAKIADYAYRSRHQVNRGVRPLVDAYYGARISYSYFVGCSGGGREALIEAQRHPGEFDGFIAGDPAVSAGTTLAAARNFRVLTQAPIPYARFADIDRAILADCDGRDGVVDGLIQNPALCAFDPRTLTQSGVLTSAQAAALSAYLSAPVDTNGRRIGFGNSVSGVGDLSARLPHLPGGLTGLSTYLSDDVRPDAGLWPWGEMPSGTVNWILFNGAVSYLSLARPGLSILDPSISKADGRIHADVARIVEDRLGVGLVQPDAMGAFFNSGARLIIYQGFDDTIADPYPTIEAYAGMVQTAGGLERAQLSARLFMAPGMAHCGGGPGPNMFDPLAAMAAWVERGVAPDSILALRFADNVPGGAVERGMPLCPFPQMARYDGVGRVEDAASWSCSAEDARLPEIGPNGAAAGYGDIVEAFRRLDRRL